MAEKTYVLPESAAKAAYIVLASCEDGTLRAYLCDSLADAAARSETAHSGLSALMGCSVFAKIEAP